MLQKPSVIFFGTPEFAVPSLEILLKNEYPVLAVVTAPDKPAGRGQKVSQSAVKEFANASSIPVLQPVNLKEEGFINKLKELHADCYVVVAFRMLPHAVWSLPPLGSFNLHASLLPDYRGSAPINWAIINGEKETGLTTFFLEREIDTGKIIYQERTMIGKNETAGDLHNRLMVTGAGLVLKTIQGIQEGTVHTMDQSEMIQHRSLKTAPKLTKENTRINIKNTPEEVCNFIQGLSPFPGAYTHLSNNSGISFTLKVFFATAHHETHSHHAGRVVTDNKNYLNIYLRGGYIAVEELQLSGKNRMKIKDFLNGLKIEGEWFID